MNVKSYGASLLSIAVLIGTCYAIGFTQRIILKTLISFNATDTQACALGKQKDAYKNHVKEWRAYQDYVAQADLYTFIIWPLILFSILIFCTVPTVFFAGALLLSFLLLLLARIRSIGYHRQYIGLPALIVVFFVLIYVYLSRKKSP